MSVRLYKLTSLRIIKLLIKFNDKILLSNNFNMYGVYKKLYYSMLCKKKLDNNVNNFILLIKTLIDSYTILIISDCKISYKFIFVLNSLTKKFKFKKDIIDPSTVNNGTNILPILKNINLFFYTYPNTNAVILKLTYIKSNKTVGNADILIYIYKLINIKNRVNLKKKIVFIVKLLCDKSN